MEEAGGGRGCVGQMQPRLSFTAAARGTNCGYSAREKNDGGFVVVCLGCCNIGRVQHRSEVCLAEIV